MERLQLFRGQIRAAAKRSISPRQESERKNKRKKKKTKKARDPRELLLAYLNTYERMFLAFLSRKIQFSLLGLASDGKFNSFNNADKAEEISLLDNSFSLTESFTEAIYSEKYF
jgi:hypothetical protein